MAYSSAMKAAVKLGRSADIRQRVAEVLGKDGVGAVFVRQVLGGIVGHA